MNDGAAVMADGALVSVEEREGGILLMGLNRPAKLNAFSEGMVAELVAAYTRLEHDDALRCGVLHAHGGDFTAGLDLPAFAARWSAGENPFAPPDGMTDPWGLVGKPRRKPVVAAAQGRCYTLGIELLLAADVRVAAQGTRFAQLEIKRGIYPVGGATLRMVQECGWGNAMRWLLTGGEFDAAEALRIGLVQEVLPTASVLDRACAIAAEVAATAPLGAQATRDNARQAIEEGWGPALARLVPDLRPLLASEDAAEGVASFRERRPAQFRGR